MRGGARMWAAGAFDGGGSRDSGYLPAPGGRWRTAKPLRGGCSWGSSIWTVPTRGGASPGGARSGRSGWSAAPNGWRDRSGKRRAGPDRLEFELLAVLAGTAQHELVHFLDSGISRLERSSEY